MRYSDKLSSGKVSSCHRKTLVGYFMAICNSIFTGMCAAYGVYSDNGGVLKFYSEFIQTHINSQYISIHIHIAF